MLKSKTRLGRFAMKLEALLATIFLQLAHVGLRKDPAFLAQPAGVTCECPCNCPAEDPSLERWHLLGAGLIGSGVAVLAGACGQRRQPSSAPVSPRRRGHGVLEHSPGDTLAHRYQDDDCWHERKALWRVKEGVWVVITPDSDVYAEDLRGVADGPAGSRSREFTFVIGAGWEAHATSLLPSMRSLRLGRP